MEGEFGFAGHLHFAAFAPLDSALVNTQTFCDSKLAAECDTQ